MFTLIYCIFQVTSFVFSFISSFSYIQQCISLNILNYINSIFSKFQIMLNYKLKDFDLETYYTTIKNFVSIVNDLKSSIKIGLILSNIFVSIIFIGSLISLLIKFKKQVLKAKYSKKSNSKI